MNMRLSSLILIVCLLCSLHPGDANAADDSRFGITHVIHGSSIFTLRDGKLLHELSKLGENWSEIFYNGVAPVLVRSGHFKENKPLVTSERFTGEAVVSVHQVSISGDDHPRRIYVGSEIYNRSPSGFFELMSDPSETVKESRLMGLEYSTKELDTLRNQLLNNPQNK